MESEGKTMTDTAKFGLAPNPFHHVAVKDNARIWAGRTETKRRLHDVVRSVQPDDIGASEFVILVGDYGGGKTHALHYFSHKIREKWGYPFYAGGSAYRDKDFFAAAYRSIVDECGGEFFSELREKIQGLAVKESVKQERPEKWQEVLDSKFDPAERPFVRELMSGGNSLDFFRKAGNSDSSAAVHLASLIKIMTTSISGDEAPYPAAYLFLDEVEELIEKKPASTVPFWQACRELINRVPGRFAMVLAYSTETAILDATVHPAVLDRMTRPYIQVADFAGVSDAKEFVRDFLHHARVDDFQPPHAFYPFTEEAVDFMLEREQFLRPRRIILTMGRVFQRGRAKLDGQEELTKEIAEEVLEEMGV